MSKPNKTIEIEIQVKIEKPKKLKAFLLKNANLHTEIFLVHGQLTSG